MVKNKIKRRTTVRKKAKAQEAQKVGLLGQALRSLGGLGGGAIGGMFGQGAVGSNVGTSLGATISKWLGAGDYNVVENSIVRNVMRGSSAIPMMHDAGQSVVIRHKEFVCSIESSVAFKVQRFFLLQPADTNTFPWLSGIANRFQQYRIKGMVFHYVPTSGYAVSGLNPALGAVMMQTSYRANDTDPKSKVEMLNEYWSAENIPSDSFCHPIECSPQENPFSVHYIRSRPVPAGDTPLLYDLGKTFIATQGMPADGNIVGDLWVTYEIELLKPQIESSVVAETVSSFATSSGTVATTTPLGSNQSTAVGVLPFTMQGRDITLPLGFVGNLIFTVRVASTPADFTSFDAATAPLYTNCASAPVRADGATFTRSALTAGAGKLNAGYYQFGVSATDTSKAAVITLPLFSWVAGAVTLTTDVNCAEL